jgi:thiol-disulfide isomerase/thioredoxin
MNGARPGARLVAALTAIILAGCASTSSVTTSSPIAGVATTTIATMTPSGVTARPAWFDLEMTDVQTGGSFTINDFAGKVVLLETMAVWCPTCRKQQDEVVRLHQLLGDPADLVSISLDTSMEEDAAVLKDYAQTLGYDWNIAVAPLLVARALGNLYSAEYLNPPASPMLIIDRDGNVIGLPYGVKTAESLQGVVAPLLGP